MDERTPLIAGNWKMFKTRGEAFDYSREIAEAIGELDDVDIAVCPPFTSLDVVADALGPLGIGVWGQTMHEAGEGAYTGEVSAPMLADCGANGVLLGHSERRALFGETDAALARKVPAALAAGLDPVLCVGESEAERDAGTTAERLRAQLAGALDELDPARALQLTIAYEPVWAIGTGRTATPAQAQEAHAEVRAWLAARFGPDVADVVRILYGGSVKPENARELLEGPDVDGALVGGASLSAASMLAIARAALPGR
jgi:triosephosphate isomerase (TIM)